MDYWPYSKLKNKIYNEHDLSEESFIDPQELMDYVNDAIEIAETIIVPLYEDYFLDCTPWMPILATNEMPTNIWANKLRKVEVRNLPQDRSVQIYKNRHLKNYELKYNIYNKQGMKPQLVFQGACLFKEYKLHFTRNANRVSLDTDLIDLPETAMQFICQYVKVKVYQKETHPLLGQSQDELSAVRQLMTDAFENIVDDGSEILETDFTFYDEFNDYNYHGRGY